MNGLLIFIKMKQKKKKKIDFENIILALFDEQ